MDLHSLLQKHGLADVGAVIERHVLPAIAFSLVEPSSKRSRFGGSPLLPPELEWPSYTPAPESRGSSASSPPSERQLDFLLQLDLEELQRVAPSADLPDTGLLTFFYDVENQPWGYDPAHCDGFRVLFFEGEALVRRNPPHSFNIPARELELWPSLTVPHIGSRAYDALSKEIELSDDYLEFADELERRGYPAKAGLHRLLGHSANMQDDMQLEAQLVTNGLNCGNSAAYRDPRRAALEARASDWKLLLQLDSVADPELVWGDFGMLYFWIRSEDLLARRFDRAWMRLQCG